MAQIAMTKRRQSLLILFLILQWLYIGVYAETAECDENKHCAIGCCSKFGVCGLGPDFCSKKNCVSTCDAKSECDPGKWGSEFAKSSSCPLNVCCSKYGFCGTTKEFCGSKKVKRPSCDKEHPIPRVVGYYEGWSPRRPCNPFYPEQIPHVYTHLNYAFATINPDTFEVGPVNKAEADLMKRLTSLKKTRPSLRVNIAIGGWTFNDVGPTATTFSDIARSEANQKKFFKSLIAFMSTYGFDGVDIDWEYPAADDRSGRPEDFKNFSKFMANLKNVLKSTGGRNELSLTIPTSYWYLQHFDIKNLVKHVDYFNYMSYDLHGKWDRESEWTGPFLDSHSNLTEIRNVMDLLWRNSISPDKVVLGLAFYGRAFTMADSNCKKPGCIFASAGNSGKCSRESGILMNNELDDIRADKNIKPTLDKAAAVQILTWGNQWVTYDDETTLKQRLEFARTTCLGGVMVWAVSHDTYDGKYSKALAGITPTPLALPSKADDTTVTASEQKRQCKWTNCGQTCSGDFVAVYRSDKGYREGELMLDYTGCSSKSAHTLCCPREDVPRCGWYGFNNGKCSNGCPPNMFEIGSHSYDCNNKNYQTACCEQDHDSTRLYWHTTGWSVYPNCDDGGCPWGDADMTETLVKSDHGSGDATCKPRKYGITYGPYEYQERSLCYNPNLKLEKWENCAWHHDVDPVPEGKSSDYCVPSCPGGKVRLSMSEHGECAKTGGSRAFCCEDKYFVNKKKPNPEMGNWKTKLNNLLDAGTCLASDKELKARSNTLAIRDIRTDDYAWLVMILTTLLREDSYSAKEQMEADIWDTAVKKNGRGHLVMRELKAFVIKTGLLFSRQPSELARDILCRMDMWNRKVNGDDDEAECSGNVCEFDPTLCEPDPEGDDDGGGFDVDQDNVDSSIARRLLEKRGKAEPKKFKVWCSSTNKWEEGLEILALGFPTQGYWKPGSPKYDEARTWEDPNDCGNPKIIGQVKASNNFNTEHILEVQLIPLFFQHLTSGTLVSGKPATFQPVDCSIFLDSSRSPNGVDLLQSNIMKNWPYPYKGREKALRSLPATWIMEAVGTSRKQNDFYLLETEVNGMKKRVFAGHTLVADMAKLVADTSNPGNALKEIKTVIGVWSYLNDDDVKKSFQNIFTDVRTAFDRINQEYFSMKTQNLNLHKAWDEWFRDMIEFRAQNSYDWVQNNINEMISVWLAMPSGNKQKMLILGHLASLTQGMKAYVHYDKETFPKLP